MARYAKDMEEIDDSTLVKWNGQIYGVWDSNEHHTVRLIPWDILISHDGDESLLEQSSVTVPIRQIQLLEPVEASQATVRALFRLDKNAVGSGAGGSVPLQFRHPSLSTHGR